MRVGGSKRDRVKPIETDELLKWQYREIINIRLCSEEMLSKIEVIEKEEKKRLEQNPKSNM